MGWFDNEEEEGKPTAAAPQSTSPRPVARSAAPGAPESGSTLGRQIHIDGTIVCDEDLTILGRVDGTIRAKGTLVIASGADVRAKIDGQRVMVHGKVDGNVQGAERVVLGPTARLTGNIDTPTLEIIEGARFKGSVEMKSPASAKAPAGAAVAKPKPETTGSGNAGKPDAAKPAGADGPAKASKPTAP